MLDTIDRGGTFEQHIRERERERERKKRGEKSAGGFVTLVLASLLAIRLIARVLPAKLDLFNLPGWPLRPADLHVVRRTRCFGHVGRSRIF